MSPNGLVGLGMDRDRVGPCVGGIARREGTTRPGWTAGRVPHPCALVPPLMSQCESVCIILYRVLVRSREQVSNVYLSPVRSLHG